MAGLSGRLPEGLARDDWATPKDIAAPWIALWGLQIDAAAEAWNAKLPKFFSPKDDALSVDWVRQAEIEGVPPRFWLNPPYGRGLEKWIAKAYDEATKGATVVLLLPASTDTIWFHTYVKQGLYLFYRGRIQFETEAGKSDNGNTRGSIFVVFDKYLLRNKVCGEMGGSK